MQVRFSHVEVVRLAKSRDWVVALREKTVRCSDTSVRAQLMVIHDQRDKCLIIEGGLDDVGCHH